MNNDEAANAIYAAYLYRFKGVVYYYLYDRANDLVWFEKSRAIAKQYQLPYEEMLACSNLGGMYIEEKKYSIAEKMLTTCDSISQANNYLEDAKYLIGKRLLATLYKQTNRLSQAKAIFEDLITESRKLNKQEVLASALTYYANFLKDEKDFDQSEAYFLEALDIAKKMNFTSNTVAMYAEMASMYSQKGDYKKANICKESAYQLKIKMFQEQMQSSITESEAKYNNVVLISELELAEKKRRIQWAIFAILGLIVLVIGLLNYLRQKRNEMLMQQKQNKATLNALIEGEEKERIRLARELHDGIVQEIAILGRNVSNFDMTHFDQHKSGLQEKIQQIGSEVRSISHSLMPQMLKSFGLVVALKDFFKEILNIHLLNMNLKLKVLMSDYLLE
jgi:signal transduction histidine kinase